MAQKLYNFEIIVQGETVSETQLDASAPVKIGSHDRVDLHIPDDTVSRVHALIELGEDERPAIIDLGSGRGTFVNGERVNKQTLRNGDVIRVGATDIRFKYFEPRAAGAAPGAPPVDAVPAIITYSRRYLSRPARTDGTVEMAVLWRDNVLLDELYNPAENLTIGPSNESTVGLDDPLLKTDHLLLDAREGEGEPMLRLLQGMTGELFVGSERYTIEDAIAQGVVKNQGGAFVIPLTVDVRARLDFGHVSIFLHRSIKPAAIAGTWIRPAAYLAFLIAFIVSFLIHFGIVGLGYLMPPDYSMGTKDDFNINARFVQMLITEDVPPEENVPEWLQDDSDDAEDNEGAIVAGEAGRAGDERAEDTNRKGTIGSTEGSGDVTELARGAAREEALQTGALAALNGYEGGSAFGQGAGSYTDVVAIGGAEGTEIGASYGTGGLGTHGGGLATGSAVGGGGGFGIGPMAVRGRSTGTGTGIKRANLSEREEKRVAVKPGTASIQGQLDREIIERVIREHRREIRACYTQQLRRNPDLEGKITISFVVDMSGNVASSRIGSTTMNNSAVEECIALRVQRWRFPEPKGGGIVRVNYPFTFVSE